MCWVTHPKISVVSLKREAWQSEPTPELSNRHLEKGVMKEKHTAEQLHGRKFSSQVKTVIILAVEWCLQTASLLYSRKLNKVANHVSASPLVPKPQLTLPCNEGAC